VPQERHALSMEEDEQGAGLSLALNLEQEVVSFEAAIWEQTRTLVKKIQTQLDRQHREHESKVKALRNELRQLKSLGGQANRNLIFDDGGGGGESDRDIDSWEQGSPGDSPQEYMERHDPVEDLGLPHKQLAVVRQPADSRATTDLPQTSAAMSRTQSASMSRTQSVTKSSEVGTSTMGPSSSVPARFHSYGSSERRANGNFEDLLGCTARASSELMAEKKMTWRRRLFSPVSPVRLVWDTIGLLIVCWDMATLPLGFFDRQPGLADQIMQWAAAVFFLIDVPSSFFVGYHSPDGKLELAIHRTSRRYLRSWFLFDFCLLVSDWFYLVKEIIESSSGGRSYSGFLRVGKVMRMWRLVRAMRLARLGRYMELIQELTDLINNESVLLFGKICKLLIIVIAANHFVGCIWYGMGETSVDGWVSDTFEKDASVAFRYFTSLHWSLTQFTPASMEVYPRTVQERVYAIGALLIGMVTFSSFVSSITSTISQIRNFHAERTKEEHNLRVFMNDNQVESQLASRVWAFVRAGASTKRQRIAESKVALLKEIPELLLMELHAEMYAPQMSAHPMLQWLASSHMHALYMICHLTASMRSLQPRQEVFVRDHLAKAMVFVSEGQMRLTRSRLARMEGLRAATRGPDEKVNRVTAFTSSFALHITSGGAASQDTARTTSNTSNGSDLLHPGQWVSEGCLWIHDWVHQRSLVAVDQGAVCEVDAEMFAKVTRGIPELELYAKGFRSALQKARHDGANGTGSYLHGDLEMSELQSLTERCLFSLSLNHRRGSIGSNSSLESLGKRLKRMWNHPGPRAG